MEQFQSLHPGIRIQLSIDGSRAILRRIPSGQWDLAFATFHTPDKISRIRCTPYPFTLLL
ncbi:MAG: hypothetical protein SOX70_02400 [Peptoniphilaceae bacterium]|nr:hypothetical protein [Peptoniphilaceae bacterium]